MDPHIKSRAAIAARSDLSGGAIAGAVVGSIVAVTVVSLIVGFLYFRWKRQARPVLQDGDKVPETERRLSLGGPDPTPEQSQLNQAGYQPWVGESQFGHDGAAWDQGTDYPQQTFPNNDTHFIGHPDQYATPGQLSDAEDIAQSIGEAAHIPPSEQEGGAADYYNTSIAMDSEPEEAPTGPTRQMTELYEEQLKKSRQSRKNSKSSTWSRLTRGFMPKRKRSTRVSEIAMEEGRPTPSASTSHPDVAIDSVEGASGEAQQHARGFGPDSELYEEPQEMSDASHVDIHTHKRTKRRGPSGDTSGDVPHRLDSLRTDSQRTEPTLDPQLPSSALRHIPTTADKFAARQATRFQSPELPDPMEIDDSIYLDREGSSAVRQSHSPPPDTAGFSAVNPMDIMRPSNAVEKAVFTNAELIRMASASVSPPTSPPHNASPPRGTNEQESVIDDDHEAANHADESDYEDEDEDEEEKYEQQYPRFDQAPQIAIDEVFITDGPSDWSTPGGTTLTNPSSGRTPATDITSSPSPAPSNGFIQPESITPPTSAESADKHLLRCEECGRTFDQIHKLNHHKRYHDRRHVCTYPDCGKKFGTKTHLDRHINDKHEKKKGFHCTQEACQYFKGGKSFPRKDNWRRHMVNKHNITPNFEPQPAE